MNRILRSLLGLNILPHKREEGSILVVGGGGWENARKGVPYDEVGFNIRRHECRYYLAVNEKLPDHQNEPRARSFSDKWSRDITQEGELIGPIAHTIATACEVANEVNLVGAGEGDIFLDELTHTAERGGWESVTTRMSSDPGISV